MNADELRQWLMTLYPFLASDRNTERFVELVQRDIAAGIRPGMARIAAVRTLADERWPRNPAQNAQ